MNFLAHLYLSGKNEDLLIGNFIADFIKNKDLVLYTTAIRKGIRMHRFIDSYTDKHPAVLASSRLLQINQGKYAPVVIDICFDYILSKNWEKISDQPFSEFKSFAYSTIEKHVDLFPDFLQVTAKNMVAGDFLQSYSTEKGMVNTFGRVAKRARFESKIASAFDDLMTYYSEIETSFFTFFPELEKACEKYY